MDLAVERRITSKVMREALERFNALVKLNAAGNTSMEVTLRDYCGLNSGSMGILLAYVEAAGEMSESLSSEDDQHIFLAGVVAGMLIQLEVEVG